MIEQVVISVDRDGNDITPGYVRYFPLGTSSKGRSPSRGARTLLESISEAMIEHGADVESEGEPRKRVVRSDHARDEFLRRYGTGDSAKDDHQAPSIRNRQHSECTDARNPPCWCRGVHLAGAVVGRSVTKSD